MRIQYPTIQRALFILAAAVFAGAAAFGQIQPPGPAPVNINAPAPQGAVPGGPGGAPGGPGAAPAGAGAGGEASLDVRIGQVLARNNNLSDLLQFVGAQANLQIVLDQGIQNKVTISLENPTVREFLETVLPANGLDYVVLENGAVRVGKEDVIRALKAPQVELVKKTFSTRYKDVAEIQAALESLRSPDGSIIVDPDSQQIIVEDIPQVLEDMQQLIDRLDVETETRVFTIKYANAQEIADQLVGVINTVEGELFVDYRNNQIIITDTPERLDRAQAIIEQLDSELTIRVIPLSFALPEDVMPLVEGLLTENGYVDFDPRTSRLIIQDIPSIVDQAIRLIKEIDIAPQMIYIESDIVQINQDRSFTLGTSAAFGKDIGAGANPSSPSTSGATAFFSFNPFLTTSGTGLTLMDVQQGSYRFQIDAMVEKKLAEVIASPRLLIQDAGMGSFVLGSQEPFSVRQQGYGGGYGGYSSGYGGDYFTQQFREVGTTMNLEVYASESGYVEMYIDMEDTRSRRVQLSNLGDGLAVDGSFITTNVTVKSGRTVVLGGIINRSKSDSHSGIPIISSIPIVGNLFKNKSSSSTKQKLLIFITPTIVNIDDPYDFAMVDNLQHIQDLQQRGATKFIETTVDEKFLDWSNEDKNEQEAVQEALQKGGEKSVSTASQSKTQNGKRVGSKTKTTKEKAPPAKEQMENGIIRTYSDKSSNR
ncbi:MAG: secretin N-terminal domain-containing protein [Candidatus Omnitrophota bacterium]